MSYSKALRILMNSPVSKGMITHLTNITLKVLPISNCSSESGLNIPSLQTFITRLVNYTNVPSGTLLTTAVYLNRLKQLLPAEASGIQSTRHRIFLACLILSAKYNNDSSPLNIHWMNHTNDLFCLNDINLMERQLLKLLNWDLSITEHDLIKDLKNLIQPIVVDLETTKNIWSLYHHQHLHGNMGTKKSYGSLQNTCEMDPLRSVSPVSSIRSISPVSVRSISPTSARSISPVSMQSLSPYPNTSYMRDSLECQYQQLLQHSQSQHTN
ncbi:hypothetical protein TBLA_0B08440 [Henningerozyma blattae CBS 6284]|uniref:Cyclin-like domain-containing protein n=1 Tax=Henningerozyma blattae (strain ATCC 34711 / CBS 6284 / DSM 70876 / NBRC 10599 / NRRL Y-10934 / UCD 77-7) TaxID=1071380 RepID=I2GZV7_HENB6|nr:hypothetical protein TBLA_0B08440 [Tetrapisispora blattae CBS 6284]CCH59659.1 hypothetical protein TBLA_0B08440 [Tetrapisispora blattae CBS 6284]